MKFFIMTLLLVAAGFSGHASAGFVLIDPGTFTKQIDADDNYVYALKDSGNIWRFNRYFSAWTQVDLGTGTKQIAANGLLYALKDNGNIWELGADDQWRMIDPGTGTRMIAASDYLWALKDDGRVWALFQGRWSEISVLGQDNLRIYAAGQTLWVTKWNGRLQKFQIGNPFPATINTSGTVATVAGNANGIYVATTRGDIWYLDSFQNVRISNSNDNVALAFDRGLLYAIRSNGAVYRFEPTYGSWTLLDDAPNTASIVASRNQFFELKYNGNIWSWAP